VPLRRSSRTVVAALVDAIAVAALLAIGG